MVLRPSEEEVEYPNSYMVVVENPGDVPCLLLLWKSGEKRPDDYDHVIFYYSKSKVKQKASKLSTAHPTSIVNRCKRIDSLV